MSDLRNKLIRLAHAHPELRGELLPLLKEARKAVKIHGRGHGSAITALWKTFVPYVLPSTKLSIHLHPHKSLGGRTGYVDINDLSRGRAKVHFLAGDIGGARYSLSNLGHELVHVGQYEKGHLRSEGSTILWKGRPYMTNDEYQAMSKSEHDALPWEKEAVMVGAAKAVAFLSNTKSLQGLDPVLDMLLEMGPILD